MNMSPFILDGEARIARAMIRAMAMQAADVYGMASGRGPIHAKSEYLALIEEEGIGAHDIATLCRNAWEQTR